LPNPQAIFRFPIEEKVVRARMEDLRALVPEIPSWGEGESLPERALQLMDLVERKQRQLIQDNVRLAGLRELTESLLRESDEHMVVRTICLYLGHAYGLAEVLVLSCGDDGDLYGYRARSGDRGFCEAIRWTRDGIAGSLWEAAIAGARFEGVQARSVPSGTPPPLPIILPLCAGGDARRGCGPSRDDSSGVIGLLAMRPDAATGAGSDPLEIQQVAFLAATLLENVRSQRRAFRETRFRECLFEAMGDGLLATDAVGRITAVNRTAAHLLGITSETLIGEPIESIAGLAPEIVRACRVSLEGRGGAIPSEGTISNGSDRIPIGLTVVHLADEPNDRGGAVMTISDLRAIREMEAEVRRLDRLAALGRFATSVAHEIRNPLAALGAGIDYLASSVPIHHQDDVALLRKEITRLDRIVRDLLEPSGKKPLEKSFASVRSVIERACKANAPLAAGNDIRFALVPPVRERHDPVHVEVDVDRMVQVLVNIVRNACEASPQGSDVEIGWDRSDPLDRRGEVLIWVQDRGPGIPPEQITHVFEPFYSTKSDGTGLGLYVCHGVVDLHGGTIVAESHPGAGARMTVRLPASVERDRCDMTK
jgi:PAS domain S-box-containing protein